MELLRFLKAFIKGFGKEWQPKKNVVYRTWIKTPFIRANERCFAVKIIINNEELDGTFSVGNRWCEIRAGNYKLILPNENVKFSKETRNFDYIRGPGGLGQSGSAGTETVYTAKVLHFTSEDIERFKQFKAKIKRK